MGAPVPIRDDIPAEELRRLARQESDGRVACWLLGLANVVDGMNRERAARQAGMDRQTLRDWVIRFNAEGIAGLRDRPRSGRPPGLDGGQLAAFKALVLRGPDPERDGVSTWRAKDLCRIVEDRFAVSYTEKGMLRLLHDLGLSWQKARPIHPEADRKAQARFKKIPGADRRGRPRPPRGRAARGLVPRRGPGRPDRPGLPPLVREGHAPARRARPAP
jgi:transposase